MPVFRALLLVTFAAGCLARPRPRATADASGGDDAQDGPAPVNHAFVTSGPGYAIGSFMTLAQADSTCTDIATTAGIPGNYIAWLSIPGVSAFSRLQGASGWIRADNEPLAFDATSLVSGHFLAPFRVDASGTDVILNGTTNVNVATATDTTGTYVGPTNCIGNGNGNLTAGVLDADLDAWTDATATTFGCSNPLELYCLQTDFRTPPLPPAHTGRIVFLSSGAPLGADAMGRAKLDSICRQEAASAGYPGMFIALVANSGQRPLDLLATGPDWVRPDSVIAIRGDTKQLVAPIDVMTNGQHMRALVWGGSSALDVMADPTGADNCQDWTNGALNARGGLSTRSTVTEAYGTAAPSSSCGANNYHLYCVQL